jgi:uncharacterized protein (DUF1810 family)
MDPFQHFLDAQAPVYETALAELQSGRKRTHWIWFIFPQLAGLGSSPRAQRFGLHSLEEARAYLAHPILGTRLIECTNGLLHHDGLTAEQILGPVDAMKLRSSMTLFAAASEGESIFQGVLDSLFDAILDQRTLASLQM